MSLDHALLFGSSLDVPAVQDLLGLVRGGQARRLAVVVPSSVAWSLPAYEVALHAAAAGGEAVVIADEDPPAAVFGDAPRAVAEVLETAGVERVAGRAVDIEPGCVLLADGGRVAADAIVALPWARGPGIDWACRPTSEGSSPSTRTARPGSTACSPPATGRRSRSARAALAAQQGAAAAVSIARHLGATVEPTPPEAVPARRAARTAAGTLYLEHDLASGAAARVARAAVGPAAPRSPACACRRCSSAWAHSGRQ